MQSLKSMAEAVGALLKERGETVAVSESSSGGLVSAALLAIPGASAYFMGGGVIYTHKAREVLLEISFDDQRLWIEWLYMDDAPEPEWITTGSGSPSDIVTDSPDPTR